MIDIELFSTKDRRLFERRDWDNLRAIAESVAPKREGVEILELVADWLFVIEMDRIIRNL